MKCCRCNNFTKPDENFCPDCRHDLGPDAGRRGEECSPSSAWVESVAKSAERTADRFGVLHGQCSGTEQTIYGEIERAFNEFAEQLRSKCETLSTAPVSDSFGSRA